MNKSLFSLFVIVLTSLLLLSCKEKEVEIEISPNMLISVRKSDKLIEVKDGTANKAEIEKAVAAKLEEKICFFKGNIYEMILGVEHTIDLYENLTDYNAKKKKVSGEYLFEDDMFVTFMIEDESNKYKISGAFADQFYNHFTRPESGGEHHVVEKNQVFSLSIDYSDEIKKEFPDVISAGLKSDMVTVRRLETVKIK